MKKPNARPVFWNDVVIARSKGEVYYLSVDELEKFKVSEGDLLGPKYAHVRNALDGGAVTAEFQKDGQVWHIYDFGALKHSVFSMVYHDGKEGKRAHWAHRKHLHDLRTKGDG